MTKTLISILLISPAFFISSGCSEEQLSANKEKDNSEIPHLLNTGNTTQLIVGGKPFIMLGGELHNSSTSGTAYMRPIWKLKGRLGKRSGGSELAGVDIFGNYGSGQGNASQAGGAIIICTGTGEYFIAGRNMNINFYSQNQEVNPNVSFLLLEDGIFKDNEWITGRRLNGDEFNVTLPSEKSTILKIVLYTYL